MQIVDMRQELRAGNRSMFSRAAALRARGLPATGRSRPSCSSTGAAWRRPSCAVPAANRWSARAARSRSPATARTCCAIIATTGAGFPSGARPARAPRSDRWESGTRQVEAEVQRLFPGARTLRWDRDAVEEAGEHDILLEHFASHRADVLIGTQMVAKGLDLPQVTLVGIVLAELGLLLPDYRSPERIFQVLGQVAGRAGRAAEPGQGRPANVSSRIITR